MNTLIINRKKIFILFLLAFLLVFPSFIQSLIELGHYKQLIIGTTVNTGLFLTSLYINDKKRMFLMSILPSLSTITTGFLFGGFTYYSSLLLPIIWIGNLFLILINKKRLFKNNFELNALISIIVKVSIIFLGYLLIGSIFNFPNSVRTIMNSSMGIMQVYTSLSALVITKLILIFNEKKNY